MLRLLSLLVFLLCQQAFSQKLPNIDEKVPGMRRMDGYIPFYWDEASGKVWMEVSRLDNEFLYAMSLPSGLGSNDIGLDRGLMGGGCIVKFVRSGRKLLLTEPNYGYRAVSDDLRERKAVEQSFAQSILWGFVIEAESGGRLLVDATEFLLRDAMQVSPRLRRMQQGSYAIDKSRSALYMPGSRNFPLNTELEATLTFVNADGQSGEFVRSVVPSAEAITLRMHHSFVQLPDDGYKPRMLDPRSGFMDVSFFDYASPVSEPIEKKMAVRHRLQKKDPNAAVSDPVKPIVYYLDNGTPEPIRSALMKGASWWDHAFAAAGYRNAFQVRMLPDSADPMDIRYNMINWVHRSTRGWSYGASVVDPRTGEIIKGQVSLGSLRVRQDYLIAQGLLSPFADGEPREDQMLKMGLDRLEQLSAHEVGHTLGLMHNFASSANERASVMDYPHPLIRLDTKGDVDMSRAYAKGIGEWDKLAIAWGYQDFPSGTDEPKALGAILQKGLDKSYAFISDRDARAPGGAHPTAHLWDNGKDPVAELGEVLKVREKALSRFGEPSIRPGLPTALLEDVLVPVYLYHRYQVEAVSKVVGGVDYTYKLRSDGQSPPRPVDPSLQWKALEALIECLSPKRLELPASIVNVIPPRPANYDPTRELFPRKTGLVFDPLSPAEAAADLPLSLLFHPERLSRLALQETGAGPGLTAVLNRLIDATWKAPRATGMQALIQQQNEQMLLTYLLSSISDEKSSFAARSAVVSATAGLKTHIETKLKSVSSAGAYAGHLRLALERMKYPEKAKPTQHASAPPGAPIGCE